MKKMLIRPTSRVLSRGFTRRLGAVEFVPVPVDLNDTGNHEATDRCQAALLPRFVELLKHFGHRCGTGSTSRASSGTSSGWGCSSTACRDMARMSTPGGRSRSQVLGPNPYASILNDEHLRMRGGSMVCSAGFGLSAVISPSRVIMQEREWGVPVRRYRF